MMSKSRPNDTARASYDDCKSRFDTPETAKTYSTRHTNSHKNNRERACIKKALSDLPKNSLILDLPCGTGRLTYFIHQLGFRVLGADYSNHMIHYAQQQSEYSACNASTEVTFEQQDVMNIKHADNTFHATVCNRPFHHYSTSELRRSALQELARITQAQGPIIVSFFNSYSLSALWSKLKNFVRNKKPTDRIPIPFHLFKKDIEHCGLTIQAVYYSRFGVSPQTYVKLKKA